MGVFGHLIALEVGQALAIAASTVVWVFLVLTYNRGWSKGAEPLRHRLVFFSVGLGVVLAAVSPPLEHLAEDLVSLHMVQHVMLILIGAPLIALSRPVETLLAGMSPGFRKRVGRLRRQARMTPSTTSKISRPLVVWMLYALTIWVWHGSVPYEAAAGSFQVHLLEHALFLGAALAFWSMILVSGRSAVDTGYRVLAVFATAFHSVLLGALMTFSDVVWYPSYVAPTLAFGADPLADQRLAGLLMWIPGGLVYTAAGLWLLTGWLGDQSADGGLRRSSASVESPLTSPSPRDRV